MTRTYLDIIREYRNLKTDTFYPFDANKINAFPIAEHEIISKKNRLDRLLVELDDITIGNLKECKNNLLLSVKFALEKTSTNKLGYPLSRNQGLIIPNYIYGKVMGIMTSAMNSVNGFGYPQFYSEINGDFDSKELRNLLQEYHDELEKQNFHSYLELEAFYEKYQKKILELWKKEDLEHP